MQDVFVNLVANFDGKGHKGRHSVRGCVRR